MSTLHRVLWNSKLVATICAVILTAFVLSCGGKIAITDGFDESIPSVEPTSSPNSPITEPTQTVQPTPGASNPVAQPTQTVQPTPGASNPVAQPTPTVIPPASVVDVVTNLDYSITFEGEEHVGFAKIFINRQWEQKVAAAMDPSGCPVIASPTYPAGYYTGPMIDSHLHIPQLSDDLGGGDDNTGGTGGVDSALYDAISAEDKPLLGDTVTIDQIACTLKQEGTTRAFAFFPVFPESPAPLIDVAYKTQKRHGALFVPFIQ